MLCFNTPMPHTIHDVYVGFGANLGDRLATLRAARERLQSVMEVVVCSRLYETPPWGVLDQPPFLNAVCHGRTRLDPVGLLAALKTIERELGRVASRRWGPRAIDLDILFFDDLVLQTETLTIPHRLLHERAFVLAPLTDLAPDLRHPVYGDTIRALAAHVPLNDVNPIADNW